MWLVVSQVSYLLFILFLYYYFQHYCTGTWRIVKTILIFEYAAYSHKRTSSKMTSRTLTWHNIDECTYIFGSRPNGDIKKPDDQRTAKKTANTTKTDLRVKTTFITTKKTALVAKMKSKPKTTSLVKTKPTTKRTLMSESSSDDERMLRMLHDAIFWVGRQSQMTSWPWSHISRNSILVVWPPSHLRKTWMRNQSFHVSTFLKFKL